MPRHEQHVTRHVEAVVQRMVVDLAQHRARLGAVVRRITVDPQRQVVDGKLAVRGGLAPHLGARVLHEPSARKPG